MTKKPTDLDDVIGAISDITTMVSEQFDAMGKRFDTIG
jgi:hypothetical protein